MCSVTSKTYSWIFHFLSGIFYWGCIWALQFRVPVIITLKYQLRRLVSICPQGIYKNKLYSIIIIMMSKILWVCWMMTTCLLRLQIFYLLILKISNMQFWRNILEWPSPNIPPIIWEWEFLLHNSYSTIFPWVMLRGLYNNWGQIYFHWG